jgi:hypothetical protein
MEQTDEGVHISISDRIGIPNLEQVMEEYEYKMLSHFDRKCAYCDFEVF